METLAAILGALSVLGLLVWGGWSSAKRERGKRIAAESEAATSQATVADQAEFLDGERAWRDLSRAERRRRMRERAEQSDRP